MPYPVTPLHEIGQLDLAWLAGLMEGEGCFTVTKSKYGDYPTIHLVSTDKDVIEKVFDMVGTGSMCELKTKRKTKS